MCKVILLFHLCLANYASRIQRPQALVETEVENYSKQARAKHASTLLSMLAFAMDPTTAGMNRIASRQAPVSRFGRTAMEEQPTSYEEYLMARRAQDSGSPPPESSEGPSSFYEDYLANRGAADLAATDANYRQFKTLTLDGDSEFDGGDSGSGAVGDGNVDLEDQHNSATLGGLRGGISEYGGGQGGGRGRTLSVDSLYKDVPDEEAKVTGATSSRIASAGKNYFGRTTGYADKLIEQISEDDIKFHRFDKVRAQQKENWMNQREIHRQRTAGEQGVMFGEDTIDRRGADYALGDLHNQFQASAYTPTERLDGEQWGSITEQGGELMETFELGAGLGGTAVQDIAVSNMLNNFAPFQCSFTYDSDAGFTVTPEGGTMNRRSGEPINVVVRYTPKEIRAVPAQATLVFETEDFKKLYKFIGRT